MNEHQFLVNLGIALGAALAGGLLARALRLPTLVGYLAAGIVVGPYTPGVFASPETVRTVALLGVTLLMFSVGVHFSLDELRAIQRTALLGGSLQIFGTTLLGMALGWGFGWGLYGGLFLGCALSLSSTAVMLKVLEERGELGTAHGRVMLGMLIVQDFALVAMIALLPSLATLFEQGAKAGLEIGLAVLKAGLFILATILLATRVVPALLHRVAQYGSRELFLLTAICICLATAIGADYAGLGLELGAFIAGIVISETDYAHEVFAQVSPLQNIFASLFFVSVGMLLDPGFLQRQWLVVTIVVVALVVGKSLIAFLAVFALGWHGRAALQAGLGLAQIGEFSFVLATVGSARGLIPNEISSVILSAALVSLFMAPFLFQAALPLYHRLNRIPAISRWLNRQTVREPVAPKSSEPARVLVLGYGRVGSHVSQALQSKQIPHLVVEYSASALKALRERGIPCIYGDASSMTVLEQARPQEVELAIVALPEAEVTEMAVRTLKRLAPSLAIVARVHRGMDIARLRAAGAEAVIFGEFEAGAEMIRQCLDRLGFPDHEVDDYITDIRQRYRAEQEA